MKNSNKTFAEQLRESRVNKGLSQTYVSDKLNISRQAISRWETGKSYPDLDNLILLVDLYGISLDQLLMVSSKTENSNDGNISDQEEKLLINDNRLKKIEEQGQKNNELIENLCYTIIIAISCLFPFAGIIVPLVILFFMKKKNKKNKIMFIFSVICIIINAYSTFIILNEWFFHIGYRSINII